MPSVATPMPCDLESRRSRKQLAGGWPADPKARAMLCLSKSRSRSQVPCNQGNVEGPISAVAVGCCCRGGFHVAWAVLWVLSVYYATAAAGGCCPLGFPVTEVGAPLEQPQQVTALGLLAWAGCCCGPSRQAAGRGAEHARILLVHPALLGGAPVTRAASSGLAGMPGILCWQLLLTFTTSLPPPAGGGSAAWHGAALRLCLDC